MASGLKTLWWDCWRVESVVRVWPAGRTNWRRSRQMRQEVGAGGGYCVPQAVQMGRWGEVGGGVGLAVGLAVGMVFSS